MIGKMNVGPKVMIAPITCRKRTRARSGDKNDLLGLAGLGDSGS
jgi:hypothetical protein